jgi:hypothetical protein
LVTRKWLIGLVYVAIAIAIMGVRPHPTPGPMLRDFEAYWAAGSSRDAGVDPYRPDIWNAERTVPGVNTRHDEILPFIGPPATLLGWSLFARLPYKNAASAWIVLLAISLLALIAAVVRGSGAPITPLSFLAAVALALSFGPVTSDLALGQLALPSFLGGVLVTLLAERSVITGTTAACLAFAQPNAAIGLASLLGRNRVTLAIALGALVTYALGTIAGGWMWPLTYARAATAHHGAEALVAIQLTPASIAYGFGAPAGAAQLTGIGIALLAVAGAVALAITVRERFARFSAVSALVPFVVGFVHEHDLVVAFAAAGWCAFRTRAAVRVVALIGTILVSVDWLGLAQRPSGILQSALLALAAFGVFVALGKEEELPDGTKTGGVLALLFGGAAWLATQNPAPVWPDALAVFHAPLNATIATIWSAEQRAAGLAVAVPAWALLRSLSLLGCALLAFALYRQSSDVDVHHVVEGRDGIRVKVF